jgi:hypothetical protein
MRRLLWTALLLAVGCDSIEAPTGFEQPFIARTGAFKRGELPEGTEGPEVRTLSAGLSYVSPGASGATVAGNAMESAYSIGIRFADVGSGYWIRPAGAIDPITPGERTWSMLLDVSIDAEPGPHDLEVVAFDEQGRPGPKRVFPACVASAIPDNQNACNPSAKPPLLVASLSWNTDADLDLTVIAPDGTQYNRSKRSLSEGGQTVARLDADGVAGCITDKRPMENFVFNEAPSQQGTWSFYANLFDSCGEAAATYTLTIFQRVDNGDGTFSRQAIRSAYGDFVRLQANGGLGSPVYVTSVVF